MKYRSKLSVNLYMAWASIALVLGLAGCSGGTGAAAEASAPVTESEISLPSSVQVVSTN